jgi:RimJ/RimL family protein N-acetyltransferase
MVRFQPYGGQINKSEISITIYQKTKQKKGLGTQLLNGGIDYLKDHTVIEEVFARVLKTNQHSLEFFRKNGFSPHFEDDHFIIFQYALKKGEGIA